MDNTLKQIKEYLKNVSIENKARKQNKNVFASWKYDAFLKGDCIKIIKLYFVGVIVELVEFNYKNKTFKVDEVMFEDDDNLDTKALKEVCIKAVEGSEN